MLFNFQKDDCLIQQPEMIVVKSEPITKPETTQVKQEVKEVRKVEIFLEDVEEEEVKAPMLKLSAAS